MIERHYTVLDNNGCELAKHMTLEMAIVFIKGFRDTFYNEQLHLVVAEEDESINIEGEKDG